MQNIPQPKHSTSQTSHISNIPDPEHATSRTLHIPNIPRLEHPICLTSYISNISHPSIPHLEGPTSQTYHILHIPQIDRNMWHEKTLIGLQYSRVSNRRDSPLINSVFSHHPQPYSTLPVY